MSHRRTRPQNGDCEGVIGSLIWEGRDLETDQKNMEKIGFLPQSGSRTGVTWLVEIFWRLGRMETSERLRASTRWPCRRGLSDEACEEEVRGFS